MKSNETKRKVGKPPRYNNEEEIQGLIDEYFKECDGAPYTDENGQPLTTEKGVIIYKKPPKPPTVTGLALALGFNTRQALIQYQAKPEFVNTIERAKTKIEEYAERRLFDRDGCNGAKFSLANNFRGWAEKQEIKAQISYEEYLSKLDDEYSY